VTGEAGATVFPRPLREPSRNGRHRRTVSYQPRTPAPVAAVRRASELTRARSSRPTSRAAAAPARARPASSSARPAAVGVPRAAPARSASTSRWTFARAEPYGTVRAFPSRAHGEPAVEEVDDVPQRRHAAGGHLPDVVAAALLLAVAGASQHLVARVAPGIYVTDGVRSPAVPPAGVNSSAAPRTSEADGPPPRAPAPS
jgi:hypothetical protein